MGFTGSLKRAREERQGAPMVPRVRDPRPTLTRSDTLQYLSTVRRELASEPEMYAEFMAVMREFKADRMDTAGVVDNIKILFVDHPDLIRGFNKFLPWGYIRTHGPVGGGSI